MVTAVKAYYLKNLNQYKVLSGHRAKPGPGGAAAGVDGRRQSIELPIPGGL
jgi:hypothetical protein